MGTHLLFTLDTLTLCYMGSLFIEESLFADYTQHSKANMMDNFTHIKTLCYDDGTCNLPLCDVIKAFSHTVRYVVLKHLNKPYMFT